MEGREKTSSPINRGVAKLNSATVAEPDEQLAINPASEYLLWGTAPSSVFFGV
jgi:hypothetical protein